MIALILSILILVGVFFLQRANPWLAGVIAVIPVKIVATALMAPDRSTLMGSVQGMLAGQLFWAGALGLALWWLKR